MVLEYADTLAEQNEQMGNFICKKIGKAEADEILLRKNKPSLIKNMMNKRNSLVQAQSGKKFIPDDSSLSNLEKEEDLNRMYNVPSSGGMLESDGLAKEWRRLEP